MFLGNQGQFSTDLDFAGIEEHDHEDVILAMMEAFEQPFHGIQFAILDEGYYETQDGLSWGVNPTYSHEWNQGDSEIKLQISRRETPTLPRERRAQIEQSYFRFLPSAPTDLICLGLAELLAEKIRACYQRNKARDIYDLGMFATRPLEHALISRLVVLKLWQARDSFDPAQLMQKFRDGRDSWIILTSGGNSGVCCCRLGVLCSFRGQSQPPNLESLVLRLNDPMTFAAVATRRPSRRASGSRFNEMWG